MRVHIPSLAGQIQTWLIEPVEWARLEEHWEKREDDARVSGPSWLVPVLLASIVLVVVIVVTVILVTRHARTCTTIHGGAYSRTVCR